jgi:hypothetical protein
MKDCQGSRPDEKEERAHFELSRVVEEDCNRTCRYFLGRVRSEE